MKKLDLSVIIVSYNTKVFLKKCLASILDSIKGSLSYEIIMVDNASTDGSVKEIQSSKFKVQNDPGQIASQLYGAGSSKFKIIENDKNLGFSKANNIGIKHARGRYLLFLNPDTIVYPKTLETMVDFMDQHRDAGAATCKVVMPNGELDDASHRGFPTPWNAFCYFSGLSKLFPKSKLFSGYTLSYLDLSTIHEIDSGAGSFLLVRREAGKDIVWWDEDYFFYGEDLDFCYRLKEKKWKVYFVPKASILHYKGVAGGIKKISKEITTADAQTKKLAMNARFKAMKIFYEKHYLKKYPSIITWLVILGINTKLWFVTKKANT